MSSLTAASHVLWKMSKSQVSRSGFVTSSQRSKVLNNIHVKAKRFSYSEWQKRIFSSGRENRILSEITSPTFQKSLASADICANRPTCTCVPQKKVLRCSQENKYIHITSTCSIAIRNPFHKLHVTKYDSTNCCQRMITKIEQYCRMTVFSLHNICTPMNEEPTLRA